MSHWLISRATTASLLQPRTHCWVTTSLIYSHKMSVKLAEALIYSGRSFPFRSILYAQTPRGQQHTTTANTTDGLTYIMSTEVLAVKIMRDRHLSPFIWGGRLLSSSCLCLPFISQAFTTAVPEESSVSLHHYQILRDEDFWITSWSLCEAQQHRIERWESVFPG